MRLLVLLLLLVSSAANAALTDMKFGRYQIADSQWNVSACLYTATCQIYSKQPGVMYKIPWYNGQWSWQPGQYVQFSLTGNTANPYEGKVYNSNGTVAGTIGTGHIVNMGPDYFFFVGNDNNTGQLFSGSSGMANTAGVTWTGTLNPTIAQADAYANATYSTTPLAAGETAAPAAPALCCGGSSTAFNANAANTAKVLSFTSRTSADSQVYIEQIGNMNTTVIDQLGTRNNYVYYYSDGSFNTVDITQSGNSSTAVNYTDLTVNGNHNDISVLQSSTGGGKGVFATVNNDYNTVNIQQKDSGNHYLSLTLTGGHKTVDVLQQGSAAHMASITLSGNPTELSLTQTGTAQQYYSITHNCTTAGGCGTIEVTQGN